MEVEFVNDSHMKIFKKYSVLGLKIPIAVEILDSAIARPKIRKESYLQMSLISEFISY